MIELLYLVFLVLVSLALGQKILGLIGAKFGSYLENFVFSLPLGLAVLAYITFFLGITGLLYKSVLIAVLLVIFIFLIKDIRGIISNLFKFITSIDKGKLIKKFNIGFNFFSIVICFLLLFVLINFIASFAPPWHFDVLAYHLAIQKIYIRAHQIIYVPYIFYSNLPSLIDTIYLTGLLLHSGVLSNMLGYTLGVVLILAIYSFCTRYFNWKVAVLASLIFYSMPAIIRSSRTSHVDLQFALFIFLSFYSLFLYFDSGNCRLLASSAIFAGLGGSSKIFGPVAVAGIFVLMAHHAISRLVTKKISRKTFFSHIFIFGLIVLIIVSPWFLKNYFFTGNPFWPAFNDVFNGKYWDKEHQQHLSNFVLRRTPSIINLLRLPWDIHTQAGKDIGNIDQDEGIGPFFLAFLPLYFFLPKKNRLIGTFFVLLFGYILMMFFVSFGFRYVIFTWPLIAIISAYVIAELFRNRQISKIAKVLLIFTFSFNLLIWFAANTKGIPVALGLETHDSFYLKYPGAIYKASKFINANLPENSKILLFRDTRGFFLDKDYVWADPLFQVYINYSEFRNEDDFYKELKSIGVTHILVNTEFEFRGQIVNERRYSTRILNMTDSLLKKYTINIYNEDGILVNELKRK